MTLPSHRQTTRPLIGRAAAATALAAGLILALLQAAPVSAQDAAAPPPAPAPAQTVVPAVGDGPALWSIRDADSTLWLFGTVHILRADTPWGSAEVDAAFDSADEIWFEIANLDDQAAAVPLVQQHGLSPDRPLSSLLTAEDIAELELAAASIGSSAAQMEPLRPWLAAITLSVAPLSRAGYQPGSGAEMILLTRARAAGKPIRGLETFESQLGMLAGLSDAVQVELLRSTLDDFEEAPTLFDALVTGWATGDVEAIDRLVVRDMEQEAPELYDAILVRRNTDWADQIQALLAGSGTAFIAVGGGHLVGDDSVQALLQARGVEVRRE